MRGKNLVATEIASYTSVWRWARAARVARGDMTLAVEMSIIQGLGSNAFVPAFSSPHARVRPSARLPAWWRCEKPALPQPASL